MLLLRRKIGESIVIGNNITISVVSVSDNSVQFSIDAPKEIPVFRKELINAMATNKDAADEQVQPQELLPILTGIREEKNTPSD